MPKRRPGRPRRAKAPSASLRLAAPRRPHPPGNVRIAVRPLFHTRLGCSAFAPRAERHFCPHKKNTRASPRLLSARSHNGATSLLTRSLLPHAPRLRSARSENGAASLLTRSRLAHTPRLLRSRSHKGATATSLLTQSLRSYSYAPRVRGIRSEYGATSLLTRSLLADTSRLLSVGSGSGVGSGAQEPMNAYMHAFARRYAKTQTYPYLCVRVCKHA